MKMIEQKDLAGTFTLPGKSMTLNRMGYGAMQLAGPGFVQTNLATSMTDPGVKAQIVERMEKIAIAPAAIARAIAFAIEQPSEVDVNEIVIRPTAQA
jgi:NADP-dependent 3-hydroxy acid dehydrogenase YdfG